MFCTNMIQKYGGVLSSYPKYIKCKWGEWNDDYIKLYVRPRVRKTGSTSIIITNSYNKKKIVIPVTICNEDE